jgi:hypothetical protein
MQILLYLGASLTLYRAINLVQGFSEIEIYSPSEVINYENDEEI